MDKTIIATIEIDTVMELRNDGEVYIKKIVTNQMPALLSLQLIDALNKTIVQYYNSKSNDTRDPDSAPIS